MCGPNDEELAWPYSRKYQISVFCNNGEKFVKGTIDPAAKGGPQYWRKPSGEVNSGYGWPQFIEHSKLQEYLKNDKLLVSFAVLG